MQSQRRGATVAIDAPNGGILFGALYRVGSEASSRFYETKAKELADQMD